MSTDTLLMEKDNKHFIARARRSLRSKTAPLIAKSASRRSKGNDVEPHVVPPRNGVPSSDEATVTIHFMRHGDTLTLSAHIDDPVYLTAPYVISRSWQLDPTVAISPTPSPCTPAVEVAQLQGVGVPHYLPGKNPFVDELTKFYHIPVDAVMGGAETMYPEYRKQLKANDVAPEKCVRYCCGWEERAGPGKLNCIGRGFASAAEPNGRQ